MSTERESSVLGSPLVCGTQYGPYNVGRNVVPVYDVASPLLWGGGRTNMYWRGPAPFDVPAPTRLGAGASDRMAILVDATLVKGQTPYEYGLLISQNVAGPFVNAGANETQIQTNNFRQFLVTGLTPSTTYYFVAAVSNGFGTGYSPVSAPYTTTA